MKKIIYGVVGLAIAFSTACKKDITETTTEKTLFGTEKPFIGGPAVDTLRGLISTSITLTKNTYIDGIVFVEPGVVLTVNAGLTMIGSNGTTTISSDLSLNKGTLVIQRGAQLIANGTATSPIVWTSENPVGSRNVGDWGGIVIVGNAPATVTPGGVCSSSRIYEAFDDASFAERERARYGDGTSPNDNSGSMSFNRIEFCGGPVLKADQEVNGLTLCGVGKGTNLVAIEVSNCGDDAFEFFGGTVDARGLISFNVVDDDFDFDEGYKGRIQFAIGYRTSLADVSGSRFIENDGNQSGLICPGGTRTQPFLSNFSLIATAGNPATGAAGAFFDTVAVMNRRRAALILANAVVVRTPAFDRFVGVGPNTNLVASGLTLSADSTYIGVNTVDDIASSIASDNNGRTTTGSLLLPLQGPSAGSIANIFTQPNGFNMAGVDPWFIPTTEQGAIPSTLNWIAGTWVSTATN